MNPHPVRHNWFESLKERNPSVDWLARLRNPVRRLTYALERISLYAEKPIRRIIGDARFNPLYHTGTITVFLLFIILFTGVYLTMFYPFGFTLSYNAVSKIESNLVGRFIRALHRYASDAAVIFALLHGWRTFFQHRFLGARWLAWTTGVGMALVVWFIGVTGYWLIWDSRTQLLNQTLFRLFSTFQKGQEFIVKFLVSEAAGSGWTFMLIVLLLHLGLSALVGLFLWWHLKRLNRPKWFPPRYWMILFFVVVGMVAILFPLKMLPPLDAAQLPEITQVDLFYLFYLPAALRSQPVLFWSAVLTAVGVVALLPWILPRPRAKAVQVNLSLCTGCTLCERDCPYGAITMRPRTDGRPHRWEAVVDEARCVSCGVCIGSCADKALSFGDLSIEPLWENIPARVAQTKSSKVVFTCERHVLHGASNQFQDDGTQVIPLTCVGMVHPKLVERVIENGAAEVQFIGCPAEDCANREGNLWMEQRLKGQRLPKLKPSFLPSLRLAWLDPLDFKRAFQSEGTEVTAYKFTPSRKHWRPVLALVFMLVVGFAAQLWWGNRPYRPYGADTALLTLHMTHRSGLPLKNVASSLDPEIGLDHPTRLTLEVDGKKVLDESYPMTGKGQAGAALIFEQVELPVGEHHIRLMMDDRQDPSTAQVIYDNSVVLGARQILTLGYMDKHMRGDPEAGKQLYYGVNEGANAGCRICHSLEPDVVIVGPSLAGIATRAATRIPGMSAEEYIRQSLLEPNAYVVEGFPKGQMIQNLGEILTEDQIDDLVAFLMTLK